MIAELEDEIIDFPAIAEETQASSHVNLLLGRYYKIANKAEILTCKACRGNKPARIHKERTVKYI
jgi:hypothetical protein